MRVTEPWHKLAREVVESASLETCKSRVATALGSRLGVTLLEGAA